MSFSDLPDELLLNIAKQTDTVRDLSRFSQTNEKLNQYLDPQVYQRDALENKPSLALKWAVRKGKASDEERSAVARKAIEAGADVNTKVSSRELSVLTTGNPEFMVPILCAAIQYAGKDTVILLLDFGADINATTTEVVPGPHHRNDIGKTPLDYAIESGKPGLLGALLERPDLKRDTRFPELGGYLTSAVAQGNLEVVQLMLEKGFDPNEEGPDGGPTGSPLFEAVDRHNAAMVKLLLEDERLEPDAVCLRQFRDVPIPVGDNIMPYAARVPFALACRRGYVDIVRLLHDDERVSIVGVRPFVSPLYAAMERRRKEVLQFLIRSSRITDSMRTSIVTTACLHQFMLEFALEVIERATDGDKDVAKEWMRVASKSSKGQSIVDAIVRKGLAS